LLKILHDLPRTAQLVLEEVINDAWKVLDALDAHWTNYLLNVIHSWMRRRTGFAT
jgi:hypothetical protein